jgi:hypothetical protein
MINVSLKFENLLNTALLDWPKNFILDTAVNQKQFVENIFNVQEEKYANYENYHLYDVCDLIEEIYFGIPAEILMRHIHEAIFGIIRLSEFYGTKKNIKQAISMIDNFNYLIRMSFEKKIQRRLSDKMDWKDEDIDCVKQYFQINGTIVEDLKDKINFT